MTPADLLTKALKLLEDGASQDALDLLTEAIQLDPEFAQAYAYRGYAHFQLYDYDAAMENYDKAVALGPNHAGGYCFRAILHGELKNHEKAITDCTRAIQLKPTLAEVYYLRALNYGAAGRSGVRERRTFKGSARPSRSGACRGSSW